MSDPAGPPAPLQRALLMTTSSPRPGCEAEFEAWSRDRHVPESLSFPGYIRATRWEMVGHFGNAAVPGQFVTLYELESDDIERDFRRTSEAYAAGRYTATDSRGPEVTITLLRPLWSLDQDDARPLPR